MQKWHNGPSYSSAGIFKQFMGARNRAGIGLWYRPARLHSLGELVPWNRSSSALNIKKFGLRKREACHSNSPDSGRRLAICRVQITAGSLFAQSGQRQARYLQSLDSGRLDICRVQIAAGGCYLQSPDSGRRLAICRVQIATGGSLFAESRQRQEARYLQSPDNGDGSYSDYSPNLIIAAEGAGLY